MNESASYQRLAQLSVGDVVPADIYVLDYAEGGRPRWTVVRRDDLRADVVHLVLEDPDNGQGDLFDDGRRLRVTVITWPAKTLRSQPYLAGSEPPGMLCDMDQQARSVAKVAA